jgi:hypothetical protein
MTLGRARSAVSILREVRDHTDRTGGQHQQSQGCLDAECHVLEQGDRDGNRADQ